MIILAVYTNPGDPQTISGYYQFKFKYTKNGPIMDFISKNQNNKSSTTSADSKKASRATCEREDRCIGCSEVSGIEQRRRGEMRRVEGVTPLLTPTSCGAYLLTRI